VAPDQPKGLNTVNDIVNPFEMQRPTAVTAAAQQMATRESAEVLALIAAARRNPRNQVIATDRIRNAFTRETLAESAQYQFSRGGTDITGPSIRAAEAMRLEWGNLSTGWREVSRTVGPDGVGVSEVEAFCVDYETTNRESIQFFLRHWRDKKDGGGYALKDERDIYELCANQAQRRKRACILAMLPGDVVEMAMRQTEVTLKSKADTSAEAIAKMLEAFAPYGVGREQIEQRIQRRLDAIQPAQIIGLKRIYRSIVDEMSVPADWFTMPAEGAAPARGPASASQAASQARAAAAERRARRAEAKTSKEQVEGRPAENPAPAGSSPPPDDGTPGQAAPSTADFDRIANAIARAKDADAAALELDAARALGFSDEQMAGLAATYSERWQAGEA
jgi:hypothetical protein